MSFSWDPLEPRYATVSDRLSDLERMVVEMRGETSMSRRMTAAGRVRAAIEEARVALELLVVQVQLAAGELPAETVELCDCVETALAQVQDGLDSLAAPHGPCCTARGGLA